MKAGDDNNLHGYRLAGAAEASVAGVSAMLAEARGFAETAGLGETLSYRLMVVIEELATNIVAHGQPAAGTTIDYALEQAPSCVRISMTDSGIPFDPRDLPKRPATAELVHQTEGGIGWPLILQWCRLEACSRNRDRNQVILVLEEGA